MRLRRDTFLQQLKKVSKESHPSSAGKADFNNKKNKMSPTLCHQSGALE